MKKTKRISALCLAFLISTALAGVCITNFNNIPSAKGSEYTNTITTAAASETAKTQANEHMTAKTYNNIKTISLSTNIINVTQGKKKAITATVTYDGNTASKNEQIEWSSKDTSVATINKKGIIKAQKCGTTYIICSSISGAVKARCKVVVREPYNAMKSLTFDKKKMCLNINDSRTIHLSATYSKKYSSLAKEPVLWSSSNNRIATVSKKGIVKGKKNGTVTITARAKYSNKSVKCKVTVKKTKYVAFTFDDGPGQYTDKLLDALDRYDAKVTFFVLGNRVNSYKNQLKREYSMGMEIGSHTYSHKNLKVLSKKEAIQEIKKSSDAIKGLLGTGPTLLRPPYGNYNAVVKKNAGVPMIYWTVDTLDWKLKNTKKVCNSILKQTKPNDIILLHDIHSTSVDGFIKALPKLKKKGYELVTVTELYQIKGKTLKKGVMYYGPDKDR